MFNVDFKNEDEVKDYIKNVGTEYSFQCYKEKTPDGMWKKYINYASVHGHGRPAPGIVPSWSGRCSCRSGSTGAWFRAGPYYY